MMPGYLVRCGEVPVPRNATMRRAACSSTVLEPKNLNLESCKPSFKAGLALERHTVHMCMHISMYFRSQLHQVVNSMGSFDLATEQVVLINTLMKVTASCSGFSGVSHMSNRAMCLERSRDAAQSAAYDTTVRSPAIPQLQHLHLRGHSAL